MIGVHGSLIQLLVTGFADPDLRGLSQQPTTIEFDRRPATKEAYPSINVKSAGTALPEYHFGGDELEVRVNKSKEYRVTIEIYAEKLEQAELMGEAVERILERESAAQAVKSLTEDEADGWEISDNGDERYDSEPDWTPFSGRSHRGTLSYTVKVRRSF